MKKIVLLINFYTLMNSANDRTIPKCTIRYGLAVIEYGRMEDEKISGSVSIPALENISHHTLTQKIREKLKRNGKLYYQDSYHQMRDISDIYDRSYLFTNMSNATLTEVGAQLFFALDSKSVETHSAETHKEY